MLLETPYLRIGASFPFEVCYFASMDERRILLVEDEHKIADALKLGLSEDGYDVETAYDGNIGWKLFQQHSFDLVVLDINLPGITGYELCKRIRSRDTQIPVIMLTALSS